MGVDTMANEVYKDIGRLMQLAKGLKSMNNRRPGIRMAYLSLEHDIAPRTMN